MDFREIFKHDKPIMGMIHLKGDNGDTVLSRAKREIDLLVENGVNAVIVENYYGTEEDVAMVLKYLQNERGHVIYGVNVLDNDEKGFEYANRYGAKFIQLDSVAGHLKPEQDEEFHKKISRWRKNTKAFVMGGVRFKYQPYNSGRTLTEDLTIGMTRCDAIVVTGEGTGMPTSMNKIEEFRKIIGSFPLIVGAGMTPDTCREQLAVADGAIVGSYFKDTYKDSGEIDGSHVLEFMKTVDLCR